MVPADAEPTAAATQPLVSCLCVTENRSAFLPWLLWSYERQTWANKELVVVDSSERPFSADRSDVRVVHAPEKTGISAKRNLALAEARGEFIAWFDDDDWQHPERLERLCGYLLGGDSDVAGCTSSWFLDLWKSRCAPYHPVGYPIFNSCVFRSDLAKSSSFDERLSRASDTPWMSRIKRSAVGRLTVVPRTTYSAWLCHDTNVSNPRTQRRCVLPFELFHRCVGSAWGETEAELAALRLRLASCMPGVDAEEH